MSSRVRSAESPPGWLAGCDGRVVNRSNSYVPTVLPPKLDEFESEFAAGLEAVAADWDSIVTPGSHPAPTPQAGDSSHGPLPAAPATAPRSAQDRRVNPAGAEYLIRAVQATYSYSWRTPPSR